MNMESFIVLDPKIYHLALHAKISVMTYAIENSDVFIFCTIKRWGKIKQNEQEQKLK